MEIWQEIASDRDAGTRRLVAEYGDRLMTAASILCKDESAAEDLATEGEDVGIGDDQDLHAACERREEFHGLARGEKPLRDRDVVGTIPEADVHGFHGQAGIPAAARSSA